MKYYYLQVVLVID